MAAPSNLDASGAQAILETLARTRFYTCSSADWLPRRAAGAASTEDIDITPAGYRDNLARLAEALTELEAGFRLDPNRYPTGFKPPGGLDADTFTGQVSLASTTKHGPLDVALVPDGTRGFNDLRRGADHAHAAGTTIPVLVASADDIVRSKSAASRPKDLAQLPEMIADFERARQLTRGRERSGRGRQGPGLER